MRRRLGIAALAATALVLLAGTLAWYLWLPWLLEQRVVDAAARRGLSASVGSVDAGWSQVELRDLRLRGGHALDVRLESLRVDAGVLELASEGRAAVGEVQVAGVDAALHLDADDLPDVLAALRGESEADSSDVAPAQMPRVEVSGAGLRLHDQAGELITVSDISMSLSSAPTLAVNAGTLALAPGLAEGASIDSVEVRMSQDSETGWQFDRVIVRDAALRMRETEGSEARSTVWRRIRVAGRTLAGAAGVADVVQITEASDPDREPEGSDPNTEEDAVTTGDEDSSESEVAVADEAAEDELEDRPSASEHEPSRLAVLARLARAVRPRLAPGAVIRLEGLDVVSLSNRGEQHVLRELRAEARALGGSRYELDGEGRPGRGGRLGWSLTVDPDALRAEGDVDFQDLPFVLLVPFLPDLPWFRPEDTTVSGDLQIRGDSASSMHLEGEASVRDLGLSSERIAPTPVRRIAASFRGEAEWLPLSRRLEIPRATIGVGEAEAELSGSLEWPEDHYQLDVRATLPPTDCNTAVGAIPADLLAEVNGFTFRGSIGGRVRAHVDSRDLDATELDIDVADACRFVTVPRSADVARFSGPFIHRVLEPDGTEFTMETGPDTLGWTPITQISPFLIQAVLGHEDGGFFRHSGFSVPSIRTALIRNLRAGRYVYGASTITMQLVKNVFLHREKTLARKLQEVILTWWLESAMDKQGILELYLNVIEYGPGIYGIREAAMHYFGRSPALLGPAESAYLATILPNPPEFHAHWEEDEVPASHRRRVARFLRSLGNRHRYDAEAVAYGLSRLEDFHFHRPGQPVGLPPESRGGTGPLPIETGLLAPWGDEEGDEDAPGTETPHEEEEYDGFQESGFDGTGEGW